MYLEIRYEGFSAAELHGTCGVNHYAQPDLGIEVETLFLWVTDFFGGWWRRSHCRHREQVL